MGIFLKKIFVDHTEEKKHSKEKIPSIIKAVNAATRIPRTAAWQIRGENAIVKSFGRFYY
jgi:hypothetical protein